MKKYIKRALMVLFSLSIVLIVGIGALIFIGIVTDYRPDYEVALNYDKGESNIPIVAGEEYTIVTYNIGYGALGKDQDFFMDGGTGKGAKNRDEVESNIQSISEYIHNEINPDFAFLQEVDVKSKRSFNINQLELLSGGEYSSVFAHNYKVKYVPVPVPFINAMGNVESGILTLSKAQPSSAVRYRFDGEEMYLQQIFDLDRCFTVTRYDIDVDKQLVLINAHFSAFDKGGSIREQQLEQMKKVLLAEQQSGNYVILGGDFNHELPGTSSDNFEWSDEYPDWCMVLPDDFAPDGYNWATDPENPTVRGVDHEYVYGENFLAVIDGFLVSENIEITLVKNRADFQFEHSDHNPVMMKFILK